MLIKFLKLKKILRKLSPRTLENYKLNINYCQQNNSGSSAVFGIGGKTGSMNEQRPLASERKPQQQPTLLHSVSTVLSVRPLGTRAFSILSNLSNALICQRCLWLTRERALVCQTS